MATSRLDTRRPTGARFNDLTGQEFGMVKAIRFVGFKNKMACFECECLTCKRRSIRRGSHLKYGSHVGCECNRQSLSGLSYLPEYTAWRAMKNRCCNPKDQAFKNYGGRGIAVCERWSESFEAFYSDVGSRPSPLHSLDRFPDQDGDYKPGNVRWATQTEQCRNTRRNVYLSFNGRTQTMTEWATELGISRQALFIRLKHMTPEEALSFKRGEESPSQAKVATRITERERRQADERAARKTAIEEGRAIKDAGRMSHEERRERRRIIAADALSGIDRAELARRYGVTITTIESAIKEFTA